MLHFLHLPREIRDEVYRLVVNTEPTSQSSPPRYHGWDSPTPLSGYRSESLYQRRHESMLLYPHRPSTRVITCVGLLRTSRQVHAETMAVLIRLDRQGSLQHRLKFQLDGAWGYSCTWIQVPVLCRGDIGNLQIDVHLWHRPGYWLNENPEPRWYRTQILHALRTMIQSTIRGLARPSRENRRHRRAMAVDHLTFNVITVEPATERAARVALSIPIPPCPPQASDRDWIEDWHWGLDSVRNILHEWENNGKERLPHFLPHNRIRHVHFQTDQKRKDSEGGDAT